jgi:hypothetical protein
MGVSTLPKIRVACTNGVAAGPRFKPLHPWPNAIPLDLRFRNGLGGITSELILTFLRSAEDIYLNKLSTFVKVKPP